jgi:hypothetical protein
MPLLRKERSHYFWVLKNRYEELAYEELQLLILMTFVNISGNIFKVLILNL